MVKLARNYFAANGPLFYNKTQKIDWNYIQKLNKKQYDEGVYCACKIKNRQVHFHNEKMKVFLAAQLLSSSVSSALLYLENDLKDASFKGAAPTAHFCKMLNDMFDILNAKNRFCKDKGKQGVTKESLLELKKKIDNFISYIENLEIDVKVKTKKNTDLNGENLINGTFKIVRKPVLQATCVRTGFTGFIISLTNLYAMCEELFKENSITYFLSYKLSQDHVEMFFALIRRMNGFTNNPTTVQFKSAYKKLMLNNMNVIASTSSNCSAQDETLLISDERNLNTIQKVPETKAKIIKTSIKKKKIKKCHFNQSLLFLYINSYTKTVHYWNMITHKMNSLREMLEYVEWTKFRSVEIDNPQG